MFIYLTDLMFAEPPHRVRADRVSRDYSHALFHGCVLHIHNDWNRTELVTLVSEFSEMWLILTLENANMFYFKMPYAMHRKNACVKLCKWRYEVMLKDHGISTLTARTNRKCFFCGRLNVAHVVKLWTLRKKDDISSMCRRRLTEVPCDHPLRRHPATRPSYLGATR